MASTLLLFAGCDSIDSSGTKPKLEKTPSPAATSVPRETPVPTPVPKLRMGDKGDMVLDIESKLSQLRFNPGQVDGNFDKSTYHAVVAFQKLKGLSRDGIVGDETRNAVAEGFEFIPPVSDGIFFDLTKQVGGLVRGSQVVRFFPISSGRSGNTPTGTFRVISKDRHHRSSLYNNAPMPFAQQFRGNFYFHAFDPVPPYPASHGCVRLTYPDAEWMWNNTNLGDQVYIYKS